MANQVASQQTINIVPVQGIFGPEPTFTPITLVGPAGSYFYPVISPIQSGLTITNSTIDSSVIGGNSPAAAYFTTAQVAATPTADADVANKAYVDSVAQGLDIKASCLYTTTNNITLSGLAVQAGGDWSSTLTAGDRILVKNQSNQAENGIHAASATGWTRTADMNNWAEVPGAFTFIEDGATLASTGWVTTAGSTGTIGVTNMPWTQFSGAGTYTAGNGLQLISNAFSVKLNGTSLDASSSGLRISTTYAGQTSITTLGTIGTGVWEATDVAVLHGGTGASDAAGARANLSAAILGANNDITSMSAITGAIASPTYVQFNTTQNPLPTDATGRLYYNSDDQFQTLSFQMNGSAVQKIGEELYYRVKCSSAITKGQVVMFTGTLGASGGLTAAPATGLTPSQSNYILGVACETGNTNDWVFITTFGEVKGINTTGGAEAWVQGQELYYNPAVTGGLTKTKPNAPNAICTVAAVVHVGTSNGVLFVRPTFGSVLGGTDGNVQFGTLNNLDVIQYDSTAQYWKNVAASTLSVSFATTAGSAGSATTATTATNLAGGAAGSLPYQTGAGATTFLGLGTSTFILTAGASAPTWTNPSSITVGSAISATSAGTATNLAGGAAASIPYQTGAGATTFLASAAGDAGKVLQSNGVSAPSWVTPVAYATVTDDTTTNGTRYPLFANQTAGNLSTVFASSTKYQYNPSTGILTATGFSGSGANLTSLPAGQLSGTIPSAVLGNSSLFIGTTSIALNRSSASQTLNGVNISGSAGSATTATTATNANNIAITDNTSSASTYYPVLSLNSTGNNAATTSSTKLSFVPSTGVLSATSYSGAGTGLTGTASGLSIGGNAATATSATSATTATTATNVAGGAANRIVFNTASGTTNFIVAPTVANTYLEWSGSAFQWSSNPLGTVTSVGLSLPATFTVSNSPVTSSGTLTAVWANQTANQVLAGPTTGAAAAPTFRALVAADIPTLNQNTTGSAASLSISGQTGLLTFTGLLSTNRTKTVRDAADTILELGGSYTPTGTWNWTSATATWPTFNQNTTGSAATLTNARTIQTDLASTSSASFNGSANITPGVTGTLAIGNGGTGATTDSAARTNLGATTVGGNLFTLTNPSAITFPRINADNTVSALDAATFRTAIGAGTGSGTVTSVTGTSPVVSSGGTTPAISLASGYGDTLNPYASKTQNFVLASPNGTSGVPTFRAIVAADIPTLNQNTTGSAGSVANAVTFSNTGGAAAGTTYNGSVARTIDYSTVGAPSATGTGASGTWGISISGNAATATSATSATNATNFGVTEDTSTNADYFPVWVTANTGNLPAKVTSTKLKFNPSSGVLTTTGGIGGGAF